MKESEISRFLYFPRNQRFAVAILFVLILGFIMFRFWEQKKEPASVPVQKYEQFESEIKEFEMQLKTKPYPGKSGNKKKEKVYEPKVQSMQVIRNNPDLESEISTVNDMREIIPGYPE